MNRRHCVQCGESIEKGYEILPPEEDKYLFLYVCTNPNCPNYGVFALPIEFISKVVNNE